MIDIPATLTLALLRPSPNPTNGPLGLSFTLPVAGDARVDAFDVTGRRAAARSLWAPPLVPTR